MTVDERRRLAAMLSDLEERLAVLEARIREEEEARRMPASSR